MLGFGQSLRLQASKFSHGIQFANAGKSLIQRATHVTNSRYLP